MKNIKKYTFFIFLLATLNGFATDYYISPDGNDSFSGTNPQTPWKTLERVNQLGYSLQSGDRILLERGGVFPGSIRILSNGSPGAPIRIQAYGAGEAPIVNGATEIPNWIPYANGIWMADLPLFPHQLIVNGKRAQLARFPNSGLLILDQAYNNTSGRDQDLNQPNGYWNGATIHARTTDYTWEAAQISSFGNSEFQLSENLSWQSNWGYFISNKFEELDVPGEWFYNNQQKRIYYMPPSGKNPNDMLMEASVMAKGIDAEWNRAYIEIYDIEFSNQYKDGVWLRGHPAQSNIIARCKFTNQGRIGIHFMGNDISIIDNEFTGVAGQAISAYEPQRAVIRANRLKNIGMEPGFGMEGVGGMIGIYIDKGQEMEVSYNRIDSTGYNGMTINASNSIVTKNIVKDPLQHLSDGAGIYCWGYDTHHTTFSNNFVYRPLGNREGSNNDYFIVMGIYLDNNVSNCLVEGNTVIDSKGSGILINSAASKNAVQNNVVYNAKEASLEISEWAAPNETYDNVVENNHFLALENGSVCTSLRSSYQTHDRLGTFENNTYYHPYSQFVVRRGSYGATPTYTLTQWKNEVQGQNTSSKESPYHWDPYKVSKKVSENLVPNGDFEDGDEGWNYWPANGQTNAFWTDKAGMDGGSIYFEMLSNQPEENGYPFTSDLLNGLDKNKFYELSFSIKSSREGNVYITPRTSVNLFNEMREQMKFPFDTEKREHKRVFKTNESSGNCRLDFKVSYTHDRAFFLDNVELYEVEVEALDLKVRTPIFTNETDETVQIPLTGNYEDLNGQPLGDVLVLDAYSSAVLVDPNAENTPIFPVELLAFEGRMIADEAELSWVSISEHNNAFYTLERSVDGQLFEAIAKVPGKGSTDQATTYKYIDSNPLPETSYYRLKQTDYDGSFTYFNTIEIHNTLIFKPTMNIYPNPSSGRQVQLDLVGIRAEDTQGLSIFNLQGREVFSSYLEDKQNMIQLPSNLAPGLYRLILNLNEDVIHKQLILR